MEKVRCEHCGNQTYRSANCGFCGKPLALEPSRAAETAQTAVAIKDHIDKIKDEYGFAMRARQEALNHQGIVIARFEARPECSTAPAGERVAVQPGTRKFVISTNMREPRVLEPGRYSVANLLINNRDTAESQSWVCVCTVDDLPKMATFVLPDESSLVDNADMGSALVSLALRTSDNLRGGVRLQMSLACEDPVKLLRTFGDDHLGGIRHGEEGEQKPTFRVDEHVRRTPPAEEKPRFLSWRWVRNLFGGGEPPKPGEEREYAVQVRSFTVADLYPRIRLELAGVIRASIRNITAQELYDTVDVRNRVQEDIQRDMAATLETFGMKIDRVSAFQFLSPEYERLLEGRGKIAIDKQRLTDRREEVAIQLKNREFEEELVKDNLTRTGTLDRHKATEGGKTEQHEATEEGKTRDVQDQVKAQDAIRRRGMEVAEKDHARAQQLLDERQAQLLQMEKAQAALDLHNQMREDEHRRALEQIKVYAELPVDKLLQVAMIQHPHLVQAFVAAQQAQGFHEQIKLHDEFRRQLEALFGKNSEQTHKLLIEAAKQLGHVFGKRLQGKKAVPDAEEPTVRVYPAKPATDEPSRDPS